MTIQEMVDMNSGKDPDKQKELGSQLLSFVSANQLLAAGKLDETEVGALSESAGTQGITMLMQSRATSANEVFDILNQYCLQVGAKTIISNQIKANQLTSAE
jgi:hypothetical protein